MKQSFLRAARQAQRRTALECATATGMSEGRFFRIETGRTAPTTEEMARLADYLGHTVDTLFPGQREAATT